MNLEINNAERLKLLKLVNENVRSGKITSIQGLTTVYELQSKLKGIKDRDGCGITTYEVYPQEKVPYEVCDNCNAKEPHYCTLHSVPVKNMNINSCPDWEDKNTGS